MAAAADYISRIVRAMFHHACGYYGFDPKKKWLERQAHVCTCESHTSTCGHCLSKEIVIIIMGIYDYNSGYGSTDEVSILYESIAQLENKSEEVKDENIREIYKKKAHDALDAIRN